MQRNRTIIRGAGAVSAACRGRGRSRSRGSSRVCDWIAVSPRVTALILPPAQLVHHFKLHPLLFERQVALVLKQLLRLRIYELLLRLAQLRVAQPKLSRQFLFLGLKRGLELRLVLRLALLELGVLLGLGIDELFLRLGQLGVTQTHLSGKLIPVVLQRLFVLGVLLTLRLEKLGVLLAK